MYESTGEKPVVLPMIGNGGWIKYQVFKYFLATEGGNGNKTGDDDDKKGDRDGDRRHEE
jgi:hypothetical protein